MKLRSGIVALPVSRRGLLVLLSVSAITVLVVVQFWEFLNWITIQQHLRGPEFNDIVDRNLDDRPPNPSSHSRTKLDEELATKYNESCVKLGTGHMERSFRAPTRCFSRDEVRGILVNLTLSASAVFTEHNITHFLDSGTLLGSVRHKTIIPFDQDVDMGIDEAGYEKIKSTPILFPKQYAMHVHNSNIHPRGSRYKELPVRIVHRESTLYVDVFVYIDKLDEKDGKKTTGPLASGAFINCRMCRKIGKGGEKEFRVPYDWIYPLQPCRFAGYELRCPNKPNEYLQFMFGKNYMKPEVFPY